MKRYVLVPFRYLHFGCPFRYREVWWERSDARTAMTAYGMVEFRFMTPTQIVGVETKFLTNEVLSAILEGKPPAYTYQSAT